MNTSQLIVALYGDKDYSGDSSSSYPASTPNCPPLQTFLTTSRDSIALDHQDHAQGCDYCQRTLAASYLLECPSLEDIAWCLATGRNRDAMERHVYFHDCKRCQKVFGLPIVAERAQELTGGRPSLHSVDWWKRLVAFVVPVFAPPMVLEGPGGATPTQTSEVELAIAGGSVEVVRTTESETIDICALPHDLVKVVVEDRALPQKSAALHRGAGYLALTSGELAAVKDDAILLVCFPQEAA